MTIEEHNKIVKVFNSFMNYVNKTIEPILAHGQLSGNYFGADTETEMDKLASLSNVEDISNNLDAIIKCHKELKDGVKGLKASGRY